MPPCHSQGLCDETGSSQLVRQIGNGCAWDIVGWPGDMVLG